MYKYIIVQHDFVLKESKVINKCISKYDAFNLIECLAEEYIKKIMGDKEEIKYFQENDKKRNYGYFIEKSLYNNDCLTVKRKYISNKGWFYNTIKIDSIVSFSFLNVDNDIYKNNSEYVPLRTFLNNLSEHPYITEYNNCLDELSTKFEKNNIMSSV